MSRATIAILGGTGVENWPGAQLLESRHLETPFGPPTAPLQRIAIAGHEVWFLSRHGVGHDIAPHRINYRANIAALAAEGVEQVIALNAVGVIGTECPPGTLGLPDQLIDYTWGRDSTFFDGVDAPLQHIDFTDPYSTQLRAQLLQAAAEHGLRLVDGGTYGATQGPRLETRAEGDRLARDGVRYIGMTGAPEAALAREKALDYASVALAVNAAAGRSAVGIHEELEMNTL